jgi:HPt (histidine-containing phosphotransfer) domain-containing protein
VAERVPGLPVIGLTAYASPAVREACLQAGMSGHLTKPLDLEKLVALLSECPKGGAEPVPWSFNPQARNPLGAPLLVDWADLEKRLRRRQGRLAFLQTFLQTYADAANQLRASVQSGDVEAIERLAHKLRGAAGFLGARGVQGLAQTLEDQVHQSQCLPSEWILQLAQQVETLLLEVRAQVQLLQTMEAH